MVVVKEQTRITSEDKSRIMRMLLSSPSHGQIKTRNSTSNLNDKMKRSNSSNNIVQSNSIEVGMNESILFVTSNKKQTKKEKKIEQQCSSSSCSLSSVDAEIGLDLMEKKQNNLLESDLDDDEEEFDDLNNEETRRDTVTFNKNSSSPNTFEKTLLEFKKQTFDDIKIKNEFELDEQLLKASSIYEESSESDMDIAQQQKHKASLSSQESSRNNKLDKSGTSTISSTNSFSLACEVTSLSSVASNYSQFDFISSNNRLSPPPSTLQLQQQPLEKSTNTNNSLTSFFFSSSLFKSNNKQTQQQQQQQQQSNVNAFDLITSKLLSFKPSKTNNSNNSSLTKSSSTSSSFSDNQSLKSNYSNNLLGTSSSSSSSSPSTHSNPLVASASLSTELMVPSSVLIFENRPSNLPAKSQQEALKHKQEYEKMVEIAKKREQKENELKIKKYQQQIKKEDFMANSLQIWNQEILKNWNEQKNLKRTQQLWWHGLPPSIRGKVWKLAIGNELNLTSEKFVFYEKKAKEKLEILSMTNRNGNGDRRSVSSIESFTEKTHESSVELIKLDVSRTFPQLCFFQRDGPYHEALHSVLGAYACYNSKIGYVQGMSFLTAILLLNMEAPDAFICLANLLNTKYLLACFCMDQTKMNRYFRVHQILLEHNIPKLFKHFEEQKVKPDLYLIEWIFTLFSKSLPLDVMSRVWDVFFRDKEEFLFRTALGILNMYKDTLIEMDFIHIVQFLTKLPENINPTQLFKSIEQIKTSIDDTYFTFQHLIEEIITTPSSYSSNVASS